MSTILNISIFIVLLFLYIHIVQQLKRSEDLEIYEMDYSTNENLQEICDIKQPVLFEYKSVLPSFFETLNIDTIDAIQNTDLKVKESQDYYQESTETIDYVVLPFSSAHTLLTSDTNARYFTENNEDAVDEAGLASFYKENDDYLKPFATAQTKYDLLFGSKSATTPLRYHTGYRHFLCVNSGKIQVKMTPYKSQKYLYPIYDYENYEFRSPVNAWAGQRKYLHEMDKIKFLEFDVVAGNVLYIPPYWWYSIKYSEQLTLVSGFTYNSIMNCVANIPHWARYYLQQSNTKVRTVKVLDLSGRLVEISKKDENREIEPENITIKVVEEPKKLNTI
uniref:Cupin-like domain-containing protein n=1 Tax=viral metagenome TaxID=1070528 RepID=A0A6C0AT74_9ZZZZ